MEVEPVTVTDPKCWKWADHRLDAILVTRPTISIVTRGRGTSQIDQYLWENLTKVMGNIMGPCFRYKKSNINPLLPLFRNQGAGKFIAIGN